MCWSPAITVRVGVQRSLCVSESSDHCVCWSPAITVCVGVHCVLESSDHCVCWSPAIAVCWSPAITVCVGVQRSLRVLESSDHCVCWSLSIGPYMECILIINGGSSPIIHVHVYMYVQSCVFCIHTTCTNMKPARAKLMVS